MEWERVATRYRATALSLSDKWFYSEQCQAALSETAGSSRAGCRAGNNSLGRRNEL